MNSERPAPSKIADYQVLPILLPTQHSFRMKATHYLYVSRHQPRVPSTTASRSLFLANVPFDSTQKHIKHLLSRQIGLPAGRIEAVRFTGRTNENDGNFDQEEAKHVKSVSKKRKRLGHDASAADFSGTELPSTWDRALQLEGLLAVVLFVDHASRDVVIQAIATIQTSGKRPIWGNGIEDRVSALGYARYLNHQTSSYPSKIDLLRSVNNYMTSLAADEAAESEMSARQRQKPDDDGFATVTRGGRTNPVRQEVARALAERQKEKRRGLENFYRFQSRESRKERAKELVKKFEEDKQKIRILRERKNAFKYITLARVGDALLVEVNDHTTRFHQLAFLCMATGGFILGKLLCPIFGLCHGTQGPPVAQTDYQTIQGKYDW